MSYGPHLNGLPHGDSLNSYYDREAREERYQAAREQRQRFGEAAPSDKNQKTKGQSNGPQRQFESDAANG